MLRTAVAALAIASGVSAALWQGTDGLTAFTTEARDDFGVKPRRDGV